MMDQHTRYSVSQASLWSSRICTHDHPRPYILYAAVCRAAEYNIASALLHLAAASNHTIYLGKKYYWIEMRLRP